MAAVSAIRCHPTCQALYQRLATKGRERKAALVAVMLRDDRT